MPPRYRKNEPGEFDEQFEFDLFAEPPERAPEPSLVEQETVRAPEVRQEADVEPVIREEVPQASETITPAPVLLDAAPLRKKTFLDWSRPLIDVAVDHFTAGWNPAEPLDLSGHLVVVPTRHSGRRFREALAIRAAEKNSMAVIPPLVVTPEFFTGAARVKGSRFDKPVAGAAETLIVWTSVLMDLRLDEFRNVFPVDPVERNFSWAMRTATDLLRVRTLMGEVGFTFGDGARVLGSSEMEPDRWAELSRIEREAVRTTRRMGFFDSADARRVAAAEGQLPEGIERITLVATPDPTPIAIDAIDRLSRKVPTEVVIYAPELRFRDYFDEWGRPDVNALEDWLRQPVDIPTPEQTIFSESSPTEQAERAADLATRYRNPGATVAIGVPDMEVVAPLEKSLAAHQIGGFDPGGKSLTTHSLYYLLGVLNRLVTTRSFDSFLDFLRCPEANSALRNQLEADDEKPGLTALLSGYDDLASDHLPDTLEDAIDSLKRRRRKHQAHLTAGLEWLNSWLVRFDREPFGAVLTEFLGEVFHGRDFKADRADDAIFAVIADQINEVLDAFDSPAMRIFPRELDAGAHFELLLELLKKQTWQPEREATDIDLQGWLELLWENAPHLIVTGMNDGKVPEAIIGHAWLPDSARRVLGLRHNDSRYARDVYMMQAFIESRRKTGGRVDFIFGRLGATDDPLRPSRLLFQCPDADLPNRVHQFFEGEGEGTLESDPVPWEMSWKLVPPEPTDDLRIFRKLSVTSFRSYLACPFRFYLKHGLRMNSVEMDKTEMESWEFGTLCHEVLEAFALEPEKSKSIDVTEIREFFHHTVDRLLTRKFGPAWTVPVLIQRRAMCQRLDWWAAIEAKQRKAGWEIVGSELEISPRDDDSPEPVFTIGGMTITGSIDRVERHPEQGIRIVDFKTFAPFDWHTKQIKTVEDCHLVRIKRTQSPDEFPAWSVATSSAGHTSHWADLQLPLYKLAAQEKFPGEKIVVAYGTIGKAKTEIELQPWPELDGALLDSAKACAEGVISSVFAREFWPPAEKVDFDEFRSLFFGSVEDAVDPRNLT